MLPKPMRWRRMVDRTKHSATDRANGKTLFIARSSHLQPQSIRYALFPHDCYCFRCTWAAFGTKRERRPNGVAYLVAPKIKRCMCFIAVLF